MWFQSHNLLDNGYAFKNGHFCKIVDCAVDLMALDSKGNIFFIEDCHLIKMTPTREITTLTKKLCNPQSIAVSKEGIVFVVDQDRYLDTYTIEMYNETYQRTLTTYIPSVSDVFKYNIRHTIDWVEKPEVIMCANDQLVIHLDDGSLLVSPRNITSIGRCRQYPIVPLWRFPAEVALVSFRKVCTNTNGNVFLLYGNNMRILKLESWSSWNDVDTQYLGEIIATGVRCMMMDSSDNLYYKILGDIFVLNTSVKGQLPIKMHYFCTPDLILDETGYYSKSNNTIEKIYFDNVYWKKELHARLAPFLQEQIEVLLMLHMRGRSNSKMYNLVGKIPKEILLTICMLLCTIPSGGFRKYLNE